MKKLSLIFAIVLMSVSFLLAQRTITGKITDSDTGEGLISASVLVEGTSTGAVTDAEGNYSIDMPKEATRLVFSYTGYTTQKVTVGAENLINIVLVEGYTTSDVVVTALGVKREKKSLGYSTQQVDGDEITKVKDANFINSLSGKVAGVNIKRSNQMGGSSNVIIRGYKSLTGNNQALFVVDGIPISNANTNTSNQSAGRGGYDFGNAAMDINPEDVESISILKGAAATALYGSRAANGVVLVTTKKGTKRKGLGVTVSTGMTTGRVDKTTLPTYQKQYGPGYSAIQGWYANGGLDSFDFGDGAGPQLTSPVYEDASFGRAYDPSLQVYDWRSYYPELSTYGQQFPFVAAGADDDATTYFETATTYNTNISIDGASDAGSFRLGFTNFDQSGILPNSNIKKNTISFSSSYNVNDALTVSSTVNYITTEAKGRYGTGYSNRNPNQSFRQWSNTSTSMSDQLDAYNQTGKNISWNPYSALNPSISTVPHYFDNYYFNAYENYSTDGRNRVFGNIQLQYKLSETLNATARVSTDRYDEMQEERIAIGSVDVSKYERYERSFYENNVDLFLDYNQYFGDKINISGLAGLNIRRSGLQSIRSETNGGLVVPGLYSLANSVSSIEAPLEYANEIGVNGFYGRATLGYDQFLYLDLTGRYDVSSTLPSDNNAYFYPAASLSLIFSEFLDVSAISFGKFRLNYANVGNDAPALSLLDTYVLNTPFSGTSLSSVPSRKNNDALLPENTVSWEAGVEMNFFTDRVGFDLSVYRSNTFNQIIPVTVTGATGRLSEFVNAGNIQNQGVELSLKATPIRRKDFSWDVAVNWAKNTNEVLELFGDQSNLQLASVQGGITLNATVGQPFGTIWGSNYVHDEGGNPIVYDHWNGGVRYTKTATPEVIGDINPDWKGGINNSFRYKDFTLSFLIDAQKGGQFFSLDTWYGYATGIYDISAGTNRDGNEVRALPTDGGGIFIDGAVVQSTDANGDYVVDADGNPVSDGTPNTTAFYASDVYSSLGYVYAPNAYHVHDASFVKLRELSFTYSLPTSVTSKMPIQGVDISFVGRNLWIIYKNSPYTDPEAGLSAGNLLGYQSGAYPSVKELGFNVRVTF